MTDPIKNELRDRLADRALREIVGGETPPDLADAILSAAEDVDRPDVRAPAQRIQSGRMWILGLVAAASVLVIASMFAVKHIGERHQLAVLSAIPAHLVENDEVRRDAASSVKKMKELAEIDRVELMSDSGLHGLDVSKSREARRIGAKKIEDVGLITGFDIATPPTPVRSLREAEQLQSPTAQVPASPSSPAAVQDFSFYYSYERKTPSRGSEVIDGKGAAATGGVPTKYGRNVTLWRRSAGSKDGIQDNLKPMRFEGEKSLPQLGVKSSPNQSMEGRQGGEAAIDDFAAVGVRLYSESKQAAYDESLIAERAPARTQSEVALQQKIKAISSEVSQLANHLGQANAPGKSSEQIEQLIEELTRLQRQAEKVERNTAASGKGPGQSGDQYTRIYENPFVAAKGTDAASTFSIDVDTASYANVRQYLLGHGQLPPPDAVRLEEFVNYFEYDYDNPDGDTPFASNVEIASCPWQPKHRLVRVGIKGQDVASEKRPSSNLVFLVDVSGSMNDSNKLPLVIEGLKQLTRKLGETDRVAIVVYANKEGLVLPSTRGDKKQAILSVLGELKSGGSTAGGAGIQLAYRVAEENFINGGANRVILCTDGDFNVGTTSTAELERMAEDKAKSGVFLTVLGFGRGNLNDAMMESISNKGNGNYHYIDNTLEARKVLVRQLSGTLVTIAKDVKIQVEFNPMRVAGYRLLGYENRMLAREDFNDDTKDAGEIGAGHMVTAFYEVVPKGGRVDASDVEPLKYQQEAAPLAAKEDAEFDGELLELRFRYKEPEGSVSKLLRFPVADKQQGFASASKDFRFASSVIGFGMLLRNSQHKGDANVDSILEIATEGASKDEYGYRAEFLQLIRRAKELGLN